MKFWYTTQTAQTLQCTDKAVDGTGYIQFRSTERNSKMTGRGDTDSRVTASKIFSMYSDPNKMNVHSTKLQQFSLCRP